MWISATPRAFWPIRRRGVKISFAIRGWPRARRKMCSTGNSRKRLKRRKTSPLKNLCAILIYRDSSSAGFSLRGLGVARTKPHRVKPELLARRGIFESARISTGSAVLLLWTTIVLLNLISVSAIAAPAQGNFPTKSQKLPKPVPLGRDLRLHRDAASGELRASSIASLPAQAPDHTIRSHVTLVQVPCTVTAPDGTQVRGLSQNDFHLFEDGAAQEISSFDASATPASMVLVIDASASIFHELAEIRDA